MKAKGGKAVSAVEPVAPEEVIDADIADPGKIAEAKASQIQSQSGKYGSTSLPAHKGKKAQSSSNSNNNSSAAAENGAEEASESEEEETDWIEIELLDEDGKGVSGEKYEIELPDGSLAKGTLDGNGFARVEGVKPGQCKVTFPELDESAWE